MLLFSKVNRTQAFRCKCRINCVGRMLEGVLCGKHAEGVTTRISVVDMLEEGVSMRNM